MRISSRVPLSPLAASLFAALALSPPALAATSWTINTCVDSNVSCGVSCSLRYAVNNAGPGDTIDLTTGMQPDLVADRRTRRQREPAAD